MLPALGAVSSLLDGLQSLTASKSSSASSPARSRGAVNPFDLGGDAQSPISTGFSPGNSGWARISPQTMSALIEAQSQSGTASSASLNRSGALHDLFSQIDADGDGSITKTEFENTLGAGGTNTTAADNVFGKLDTNGDGSVGLDELKSALQVGHRGHHHVHVSASTVTSGSTSAHPSTDPTAAASLPVGV